MCNVPQYFFALVSTVSRQTSPTPLSSADFLDYAAAYIAEACNESALPPSTARASKMVNIDHLLYDSDAHVDIKEGTVRVRNNPVCAN